VQPSLLADGTLVASHPGRLAEAVGGADASKLTLDAARDAGADDVAFPVVEDLMRHFASLSSGGSSSVSSDGGGGGGGSSSGGGGSGGGSSGGGSGGSGGGGGGGDDGFRITPPTLPHHRKSRAAPEKIAGPVLALDLKGPALTPTIAAHLADLATSLGIEEQLLVYVWGTSEAGLPPPQFSPPPLTACPQCTRYHSSFFLLLSSSKILLFLTVCLPVRIDTTTARGTSGTMCCRR
jgi:hypothetical protein